MSQAKINACFLEMISHGGDLLNALSKGDLEMSPELRLQVTIFKGSHSNALSLARLVPAPPPQPQYRAFDGGPESNPPADFPSTGKATELSQPS